MGRVAGPDTRWTRGIAALVTAVLFVSLVGCSSDGSTSEGATVPIAAPTAPAEPSAAASPSAVAPSSARPSPSKTSKAPVKSTTPAHSSGFHTVTIVNATQKTLWVAATQQKEHPIAKTRWTLAAGESTSVRLPTGWGGRIWARAGCKTDGSGRTVCQSGYCADSEKCVQPDPAPTTLAEFALDSWGGMDFYDVSMVDGSNLPMWINIFHTVTKDPVSAKGCSKQGCTKPVDCPATMAVVKGGSTVACKNPCTAFNTDETCCRGAWAGREKCVPSKWKVDYTQVFKKAEPFAYSYAFDDSATMSCKGACDYRVTFGPSPQ